MKLVILTGAGISADSGVTTFRDPDGIWAKYSIEEVATPEAFAANPALVHAFYNMRRAQLPTVYPNAAHKALADLEKRLAARGDDFLLVTQNVDDLHERAGSQAVCHMHGALNRIICVHCGEGRDWIEDLSVEHACGQCQNKGGLRPDIVWFGEMPKQMRRIEDALAEATHFASIGTSGTVYPAAGFVAMAKQYGTHTVELNLEPSSGGSLFDETHYGRAADIVPHWTEGL